MRMLLGRVSNLTDELNGLVQPGKELLTVVVVDRNAHEVTVTDEIWLGTGVAGIEDVAYPILGHQILAKKQKFVSPAQDFFHSFFWGRDSD